MPISITHDPSAHAAAPASHAARLSHLQLLESESIHIFREVAAEFQRPVMLYSIGKDSSVMLRLRRRRFIRGRFRFLCCISTRGTSSTR
jgi:sulfate adenylyltransferase subunit 2